ncbi:CidA/LrgA family protein [Salmonella enterica]|nr:CidA/LrgA family protein [Salmonella enterica]
MAVAISRVTPAVVQRLQVPVQVLLYAGLFIFSQYLVSWLLAEMLLFFVPAVVAVVNYAHLLLVDGWRIFSVIAISTLMVLGATAWVVDKVYRYEMSRLNRE